ncbi:MAG: ligase-associated DNA damage response DEXH box helicase [Maricaulaceae bacterium]|jgi:ATP-dependent Lhr-like helicase
MRDEDALSPLPSPFADWFAARGWAPRPHQLALVEKARKGESALLIAPTGGGKTLAGFLPSLIDLHAMGPAKKRPHALHTLYVSPLKALATDVHRNLTEPAKEMDLDVRIEARTGDTSPAKRQRQRAHPPDIMLTTPEQLGLFLAQGACEAFFGDLKAVIVDEAHALAPSKRGDLLALGLAALERYAPGYRRVGLSATVADPNGLARWLAPQEVEAAEREVSIVFGAGGADARVDVLGSDQDIPWAGHSGRHALGDVYEQIKSAKTALVFVNTRSQAEMTFSGLWAINDDNLPIALHHGSLAVEQRRKVEAAMTRGALRAVVCTSTLDLGIDWGDVDLVIQMGAPKGSSRLIQRIGRSNHRLDEPSHALLTPSNRFEVLECIAAKQAVEAGDLDGDPLTPGGLDVLAQHVMGRACGDPFDALELYDEVRAATPYRDLDWETFERVIDLVSTGGYALKTYDRFRRIVQGPDKLWRARDPATAHRHRMNIGAIVEASYLDVRLVANRGHAVKLKVEAETGKTAQKIKDGRPGKISVAKSKRGLRPGAPIPDPGKAAPLRPGRMLGKMEEWFIEHLAPGDTFLFAGEVLRLEAVIETTALVSRAADDRPKVPSWGGAKFPLSTFLAKGVRAMISDPSRWSDLPEQVRDWLEHQRRRSLIPAPDQLLIETYPRANRNYLAAYPFEGRLAHQTLGMLLTRRLERSGFKPLGFVANDYALLVWAIEDLGRADMADLFDEDMLGDDLDAWIAESALMKRTFRDCAMISGLIERRLPGHEKTGRQVTFSTDLIYDVLRSHQPDHILLEAAWRDAGKGLLDIARLGERLKAVKGKLLHSKLDRISPLAVPLMLEIGKVPIQGAANEAILAEAASESDLVAEAMGE